MKTEWQICDAILQNPQKITVCGRDYLVHPPTVATMIEVSKYVSTLPSIDVTKIKEPIFEVLKHGKDVGAIANIAAILILGKENLTVERKTVKGWWIFKKVEVETIDKQKEVSTYFLDNLSMQELSELMIKLFELQNVAFFLSTMDFLKKTMAVVR